MIKYVVNKEKRTIIAMIKFVDEYGDYTEVFKNSQLIFDDLWMAIKRLNSEDLIWTEKYRNKANKMYFPKYMIAKAKCNPEDEWNEDYGKELAYERLIEKIRDYRCQAYRIITDLTKEIDELTDLCLYKQNRHIPKF